MTDILQNFIDSLPPEDTLGIDSSMKDRRVMSILCERGVTLPDSILSELENDMADKLSHEAIMESMRPFMGMRLEDFPTIQQR